MNLTDELASFEVRGTWYGRMMVALRAFKWALLTFFVIGVLPAGLIATVVPDSWKPYPWLWAPVAAWLAGRGMRRRTRVWSAGISPSPSSQPTRDRRLPLE